MAEIVKMKVFLIVCCLGFLFSEIPVYCLERKVTTTTWPNCEDFIKACPVAKEKGLNVIYSKATHKSKDNLYYAFSTVGVPTVVMAHTTGDDRDMYFNWTSIVLGKPLKDAIKFTGKPSPDWTLHYRFGVAFTKLIEYDDKNDTANVVTCDKNGGNFTITSFDNFIWQPVDNMTKKNEFVFKSKGTRMTDFGNGSLSFSFAVKEGDGRDSVLPKLKYMANETLFDFEIDGIPPSYNQSRFAVEVMVSSSSTNKDMSVETSKSIDDEYAPGVFLITDWLSNPAQESVSGFMQWKPVAYFAKDRGRKTATKVTHYTMDNRTEKELVEKSLVYALFSDDMWTANVIHRTSNISFGLTKDKFYVNNNYTVWTGAIGYGSPPADGLSSTVIIIISAGLGIPVVVIIFGAIYMIVRKCRRQGQEYEPIVGDDGINRTNPMVN